MGGAASVPEVGRLLPGLVEAKGGREAGEEARASVQEGVVSLIKNSFPGFFGL